MHASDWISLGALLIAGLSWFDSLRRINQMAVRFEITEDSDERDGVTFVVRNSGTATVRFIRLDADDLKQFPIVNDLSPFFELEAGQSATFTIGRDHYGDLPREVRIRYRRKNGWKERHRVAQLPHVPAHDESKPTG